MTTTRGDQYWIDCPACGKLIRDLWDLGDSLFAGNTTDCPHCGTELTIEEVDMTVEVTLSANDAVGHCGRIRRDRNTEDTTAERVRRKAAGEPPSIVAAQQFAGIAG